MRLICGSLRTRSVLPLVMLVWGLMAKAAWAGETAPVMVPEQVLQRLAAGNGRFVVGKSEHPNADDRRRAETAQKGQKPFVTLVSCSDSRVPPEMLFDCGIGDLFVIRVAGNVCDVDEIGTIEYGVEHLGTPVLVVMGHSKCGAVTAVVNQAKVGGSIPKLVSKIVPAAVIAQKAHPDLHGDALVPETIKANIWQSIEDVLKHSEIVRERVVGGKLRVEGALYDIEKGEVQWLGRHPNESGLLGSAAGGREKATAEGSSGTRSATTREIAASSEKRAAPDKGLSPDGQASPSGGREEAKAAKAAGLSAFETHAAARAANPGTAAPPASRPAAEIVDIAARVTTTRDSTPERAGPGVLERFMADELYRQGTAHVARGDYAAAAERFHAALEMDPSLVAAMNDLAGVYYLQRDYGKAVELYNMVLASDSSYEPALRGAALVHATQKRYAQARELLQKVLSRNNRDAQTWLDLGDVLFLMGDTKSARQTWTRAAQVDASAKPVVQKANQRLALQR